MCRSPAPSDFADRDVGLLFLRQGLAVGDAGEAAPPDEADGDHGVQQARPQQHGDGERQYQRGHGGEAVGDAHQHLLERAAIIARAEAERHADGDSDRQHDRGHRQRPARAEHHAGQHVAADFVGAHRMLERGRPRAPRRSSANRRRRRERARSRARSSAMSSSRVRAAAPATARCSCGRSATGGGGSLTLRTGAASSCVAKSRAVTAMVTSSLGRATPVALFAWPHRRLRHWSGALPTHDHRSSRMRGSRAT